MNPRSFGPFIIGCGSQQGDPITVFLLSWWQKLAVVQVKRNHRKEGINIFDHEIKL